MNSLPRLEWERQAIHVFGGLTMVVLALILPEAFHVPLLLIATGVIGFSSYALKRGIWLPLISWIAQRMERPENMRAFPLKGSVMWFVGALITAMLFDPKITAGALIVLALGDGFATICGVGIVSPPLFYNLTKNWAGLFGGILAALVGLLFLYPAKVAVLGAIVPMLIESLNIRLGPYQLDDNLLIPPIAGVVLWLH